MDDSPLADKPRRYRLVLLVALALLVRSAVVVGLFGSLDADPDAYRALAENLRNHGVFGADGSPTAFRPPLYPLCLAATTVDGNVSSFVVAVLHIAFGLATVVLTYRWARDWKLGRWSLLAAGLVAIDPILLRQSTLVMTETLATLLAVAGLLALTSLAARPHWSRAACAGAVLALAALCRPTFLPWLALAAVALLRIRGGNISTPQSPSRWRLAATLMLAAGIVLAPWAVRNYLVLGAWKVTTTHGGYTVLLGNNPSFYRYLRESAGDQTWDSRELAEAWQFRRFSKSPQDEMWVLPIQFNTLVYNEETTRTEIEDDRFAYALAGHYIRQQPRMFVYACLVRVARLWQLTPYKLSRSEPAVLILLRVLIGAWYAVCFALAIVGLAVRRSEWNASPLLWGWLLAVSFTAVHAVYWSNMRMRAPLMPLVYVLATAGVVWLSGWRQRHKH